MIRFLVKRPVAVCIVFLGLFLLGLVSYQRLPVSLLPDIAIPEITVRVSLPDYTARELENNYTKPLRRYLQQCGNLSEVSSETRDGNALIRLRFNYGTDMDYAAVEINEKIDLLMNAVTNNMKRPRVIKASATDIPVLYLNMTSASGKHGQDFLELSRFTQNVIRKRIEQLPEVGFVDVTGTEKPIIRIIPDKQKIQSLGLSYKDIETMFSYHNLRIGNIQVTEKRRRYNIRFTSQISSAEAIRNILIKSGNRIFKLKDIARVEMEAQKREGLFVTGSQKGISLAVIKQADAKMQDLKFGVVYRHHDRQLHHRHR